MPAVRSPRSMTVSFAEVADRAQHLSKARLVALRCHDSGFAESAQGKILVTRCCLPGGEAR